MDDDAGKQDALLVNLILMFKGAAMQQMGKVINPLTGKVEKSLEQARFSIDMIAMLKAKTASNISHEIDSLFDATLLELRMNYVEEVEKEKREGVEARAEAKSEEEAAPKQTGGEGEGKAGSREEVSEGDTPRGKGDDVSAEAKGRGREEVKGEGPEVRSEEKRPEEEARTGGTTAEREGSDRGGEGGEEVAEASGQEAGTRAGKPRARTGKRSAKKKGKPKGKKHGSAKG